MAGAALAAFDRLGLSHVPVGTGNTARLVAAIELLEPAAAALTPSYAAYLVEWAAERDVDLRGSSVERVLVAGEPGGGEPSFRAMLEEGWGARVTEAMGIGDIGPSLWGECEHQDGMHLGAHGFVHPELIDPETDAAIDMEDGATGELVLTHLQHRAAPLLRFRTRDHVEVRTSPCRCGRTGPRIRCIGRTDDMLIVRGVNVFPSAVREVVSAFAPQVSGHILVKPEAAGVKQEPPLPVSVELAPGAPADAALAEAIGARLREVLVVQARVDLVPPGTLGAASTNRSWSRCNEKAPESGRPPHHDRRSRPADVDRLLGGSARHAVRVRAAQPRQRVGEPSLLRPGRRAPDHDLHQRGASGRPGRTPTDPGCVHHLAFSLSQATFHQAVERLDERGIQHSGVKDRGFMDSIYFEDPLGLLIELASYRFEPPVGYTHAEVLLEAHRLRVERGDYNIDRVHLADAIETLVTRSRASLSDDRSPKDPYG